MAPCPRQTPFSRSSRSSRCLGYRASPKPRRWGLRLHRCRPRHCQRRPVSNLPILRRRPLNSRRLLLPRTLPPRHRYLRSHPDRRPTETPFPSPTLAPSPLLAVSQGDFLEQSDPGTAAAIRALPWVRSGMSEGEIHGLSGLTKFALAHPSALDREYELHWLDDGLSPSEVTILEVIGSIDARFHREVSSMVAAYLGGSANPVSTLQVTQWQQLSVDSPELFVEVWSLPWVSGGVDSFEWNLVARLLALADSCLT